MVLFECSDENINMVLFDYSDEDINMVLFDYSNEDINMLLLEFNRCGYYHVRSTISQFLSTPQKT